ncbi:histidine phosphatase family protein [Synechococcus sp. PCC 6312]|uniref:histidine phosphatase family protein n=1 Tax=Synechococcus sp. (strain ATCC 27167 / PCC 6312) TaxID=195253 RepID=UPI00029ED5E5|nr:histidine phosphatase family protein [Synechococcus sp. PCC 6312]AFY59711.1 fructose-2,6-bisphosphatase [Synechococcus sp. PCC 6312]
MKTKIWVAIGVSLLTSSSITQGATAAPVSKVAEQISTPTGLEPQLINGWMMAQGGEGGEGGEGAAPAFQNKLSGPALLATLRQGGTVIFFRHGQTEIDYADQITAKMGYCNTQRMLSERGWQQARTIGKAFQSLKIPVGEVYASEYCRAWQTADLAFGRYEKRSGLNFAPAEEYTEAQIEDMRRGIMPLLTAAPAPKTNTIIVGHDDVFEAATGIYPEPQGVAYILKPSGNGGFEILAKVLPDEWAKLGQ